METSTEMVRYNYSLGEVHDLCREQARFFNERNEAADNFKSVQADHKNTLAKLEADINKCTQRVTSGYEMRQIKCLMLKGRPDNESLLLVRTDNGKILKKRRMNADERQIVITDQPPEVLEFEVDLCEDLDYAVVVEDVQITRSEAKELGAVEGLRIRPMAKKLEGAA